MRQNISLFHVNLREVSWNIFMGDLQRLFALYIGKVDQERSFPTFVMSPYFNGVPLIDFVVFPNLVIR